MSRTLILSQVLAVRDFRVTYPCCVTCYSKAYQEQDRWHCVKCSRSLLSSDVQARYRLNLHITDHQTECDVTVFGKQLEAYFGSSATVFARYTEDARAHLSGEAVNHAINKAFVGRVFFFGFRGRETSSYHIQQGPSRLASIVDHAVPYISQSSQANQHNACRVNIIAWQMIRPNAKEKLSTVVDHLQEQYRSGKEDEFDVSSADSSLGLSPLSSLSLSGASHRLGSTLDYTDNIINKITPGFHQSLHLNCDKSLDWDTSLMEKDYKFKSPSVVSTLCKRKCSSNETEEHKSEQIIALKHKQYKRTLLSANLACQSASFSSQCLSIGIQNVENSDEEKNDVHSCTDMDRRKMAMTRTPIVNEFSKSCCNIDAIDMSSDSNDDDEQNLDDCWDLPESEDLDAFLRNLTAVVTESRKQNNDRYSHASSSVKNDRKPNTYVSNNNTVSRVKRGETFGICKGVLNLTSLATTTQSFRLDTCTGLNNSSYQYSLIGNCLEGPGHCAVFAANQLNSKITDQTQMGASEVSSQIPNDAPYSEDLSAFLKSMTENEFNESPPTGQYLKSVTRKNCGFDDRISVQEGINQCKITNSSDEKIDLELGESSVNFKATDMKIADIVRGCAVANDLKTNLFALPQNTAAVTQTVQPNVRKYLDEKYEENITEGGEETDVSTIENSQEDITPPQGGCIRETNVHINLANSMEVHGVAGPLFKIEKPVTDLLKDERTKLDRLKSCDVINDTPDAGSNLLQQIAHQLPNLETSSSKLSLQITNQDKSSSRLSNDQPSQVKMNIEMDIQNQQKLLADSLDEFEVIKDNSCLPNNLASHNSVICTATADLSKISVTTIDCSDDMFGSFSEEQTSFRSEEQPSLLDLQSETVNSRTDLEKCSHPPSDTHLTKRANTVCNNGNANLYKNNRKSNGFSHSVRRSVHFARRLSSVASVANIDLRMTLKTPIPRHRETRRKSCLKENVKPRQYVEIKPEANVDLFQKNNIRIIAGSQDLFTPSPGSSLCPRSYVSDSDDEVICQSTPLFQRTQHHRKQSQLANQQSRLTTTNHTSRIKGCTNISQYYLTTKSHLNNTSSGALKSDTSHLNLINKCVSYNKNDAKNDNTDAVFDSETSNLFDTSGELFSSYNDQTPTETCQTDLNSPHDSSTSVVSQNIRTRSDSNRGAISPQDYASNIVSNKTTEADLYSVKFDRSASQDLFDDSLGFTDTRNEVAKKLF